MSRQEQGGMLEMEAAEEGERRNKKERVTMSDDMLDEGEARPPDAPRCRWGVICGVVTGLLAGLAFLYSASAGGSACSRCAFVRLGGAGAPLTPVSSPLFGDRCYTIADATAKIAEGKGTWPGVADFSAQHLPQVMMMNPDKCFQLPEGSECFITAAGDTCSAAAAAQAAS